MPNYLTYNENNISPTLTEHNTCETAFAPFALRKSLKTSARITELPIMLIHADIFGRYTSVNGGVSIYAFDD